jgi:8-oxo-dGTP pyrophosphatase MutT (NUDIX family)
MLCAMTGVPTILDPRSVPMIGVDAHLPAHPEKWLGAQALREHWRDVPVVAPERAGDGGRFPGRQPRAAAVLVPLVLRPEGVQVLLTRRTEALRDHAGQVSFPGGSVDASDQDAWATASREAFEEVGLEPSFIERLGTLPVYRTVTAFDVTPCVALVQLGFGLRLQEGEVADVFEVPLVFLMNPAHHRRHKMTLMGVEREFLSMPWQEHFIWGATAAILRNLYFQLAQGR